MVLVLNAPEYKCIYSTSLNTHALGISLQVICMHLLHDVVLGTKHFGPVYGTWMFSFERFNRWMCRRAYCNCLVNCRYLSGVVMVASGRLPKDINEDALNPPGRALSVLERQLPNGPIGNVKYHNKITVRDRITNRQIEYSCTNIPLSSLSRAHHS